MTARPLCMPVYIISLCHSKDIIPGEDWRRPQLISFYPAMSIGYNPVWSELCECNEQTYSRQCCNLLISWPVNVGDVFIEAWLLVWLARPICQRLCRTLCSLTPDNLFAVSYDPLTHYRHNGSIKVGHETSWLKSWWVSMLRLFKCFASYVCIFPYLYLSDCVVFYLSMDPVFWMNNERTNKWSAIHCWLSDWYTSADSSIARVASVTHTPIAADRIVTSSLITAHLLTGWLTLVLICTVQQIHQNTINTDVN